MNYRSPKRAMKEVIRQEAEKHTGRSMTNGQAKKWLKKQASTPKLVEYRPFRWPQAATLPTLYRGMAALVRPENTVPWGWGRLHQPGMSEGIQMPLWFWWSFNAVSFVSALPKRIGLWILGFRKPAQ